jgi:hypothetical protein
MGRLVVTLIVIGVLFVVTSCASFNEPPASIYPDREKNPSAYKIDPLP